MARRNFTAGHICNECKQRVYVGYDQKGYIQVEYPSGFVDWKRHRCYDSERDEEEEKIQKLFAEIRRFKNERTAKELEEYLKRKRRACRRDISITVG